MKKNIFVLLTLTSILLTSCGGTKNDDVVYIKHFGLVDQLKDQGLVTYYKVEGSPYIYDSNKNEIKTPQSKITDYISETNPVSCIGRPLEIYYSDAFVTQVRNTEEFLLKDAIGATSSDTFYNFESSYLDFYQYFYSIYRDIQIAYISSSLYEKEEDILFLNEMIGVFTEMKNFLYTLDVTCSKSVYCDLYFSVIKGLPLSEIDDYIKTLDLEKYKLMNELNDKINNIQNEYIIYKGDPAKYINSIKETGNELASLFSAENYLSYLYENEYLRDYTPLKALSLKNYIKNYILPCFTYIHKEYNDLLSSFTEEEENEFKALNSNSFASNLNTISSYMSFLGNNYKKRFDKLLDTGSYFLSSRLSSSTTAYSSVFGNGYPFLTFSGKYQKTSVFIHEFGHYNADYYSLDNILDLSECHSQGNEMLFSLYLSQKSSLKEKISKAFNLSILDDLLLGILKCYMVADVEYYAYNNDNITTQKIQNAWDNLANEFKIKGIVPDNYWNKQLILNTGYYISYSVSAQAILQLYTKSKDNINNGIEIYDKFLSFPSDCMTFNSILEYSGLDSVFDESGYENIKNSLIPQ